MEREVGEPRNGGVIPCDDDNPVRMPHVTITCTLVAVLFRGVPSVKPVISKALLASAALTGERWAWKEQQNERQQEPVAS